MVEIELYEKVAKQYHNAAKGAEGPLPEFAHAQVVKLWREYSSLLTEPEYWDTAGKILDSGKKNYDSILRMTVKHLIKKTLKVEQPSNNSYI